MSKKSKLYVMAACMILTILFVFLFYYSGEKKPPLENRVSDSSTTSTPSAAKSPDNSEEAATYLDLGASTEETADLALRDIQTGKYKVKEPGVIGMMHYMTHQKVIADQKTINIEMKPERVKILRNIIENHLDDKNWNHAKSLLEIAKKWGAGNFSEVDKDHNFLWKLEDGKEGEATGILTKEEEQAFINKYFRKK